jgi:hypothetical protein
MSATGGTTAGVCVARQTPTKFPTCDKGLELPQPLEARLLTSADQLGATGPVTICG